MIRRQVKRETLATVYDTGKARRVIVTLDPYGGRVEMRLKGTRRAYALPADYLYMHACKKFLALEKANKAKERKARRKNGRRS